MAINVGKVIERSTKAVPKDIFIADHTKTLQELEKKKWIGKIPWRDEIEDPMVAKMVEKFYGIFCMVYLKTHKDMEKLNARTMASVTLKAYRVNCQPNLFAVSPEDCKKYYQMMVPYLPTTGLSYVYTRRLICMAIVEVLYNDKIDQIEKVFSL